VKVVSPDAGNAGMNLAYTGFLFSPVGRKLYLPGQGALRPGQLVLVFFERAHRLNKGAIRQSYKAGNAHIDADHGSGRMLGRLDLALSLEADKPVATVKPNRAVFHGSENAPRLAECDPAKPGWQLYSPPFQLAVFVKIHEADAVSGSPFLLKSRALGVTHFLKISLPGGIQVFEFLLQVVVRLFQPLGFQVFFPACHPLCHRLVARHVLAFGIARGITYGQRLIPHEPSMTTEHPQAGVLYVIGVESIFEALAYDHN